MCSRKDLINTMDLSLGKMTGVLDMERFGSPEVNYACVFKLHVIHNTSAAKYPPSPPHLPWGRYPCHHVGLDPRPPLI